jgi:hypothetical protein
MQLAEVHFNIQETEAVALVNLGLIPLHMAEAAGRVMALIKHPEPAARVEAEMAAIVFTVLPPLREQPIPAAEAAGQVRYMVPIHQNPEAQVSS